MTGTATTPSDTDRLQDSMAELLRHAASFIAPARVEETTRGWLARSAVADPHHEMLRAADALALATDLALFTPSASGVTALDRLARQRGTMTGDDATALDALRRAKVCLLRVEALQDAGIAGMRDLASGDAVDVLDHGMAAEAVGLALLGRLATLPDGCRVFVGCVTPLDEAALAVAAPFLRPGGLAAPLRCAEAVYRHVLRHGTPEIAGLNRPVADDPELDGTPSALDQLALRWAQPGAPRDADDVKSVRNQADLDATVAMLTSIAATSAYGLEALSEAYAAIASIQLETLHRRALTGSGPLSVEAVERAVEAAIEHDGVLPGIRGVFAELRAKLGAAPSAGRDAELDRLIGRIQALRAKTVEQGCTEPEALAAAEKVAALLDRYGLSLSELDLQRQACEGGPVETARRRSGPVDDCVPTIAAFFDCRVWGEKSAAGTLRYVFFGLPADVAGARYLYDLVELAFERETAAFRSSATYAGMPSGGRRTASNSFGIGLARGIAAKPHTLREAREAALRGSSGRDLVLAKESVVDAELEKLGLNLTSRSKSGGRRVLLDAFEQGREAGLGFEYTPGITQADGR